MLKFELDLMCTLSWQVVASVVELSVFLTGSEGKSFFMYGRLVKCTGVISLQSQWLSNMLFRM